MLTFSAKLSLYHGALTDATQLVTRATESDLRGDTPCAGWDLAALLSHMIGQNDGFATVVTEGDAARAAYHAPAVSPESLQTLWDASVARLRAAFAGADPEAKVYLAEFGRIVTVDGALGMQLLDTAVHAWDVATALGTGYQPNRAVTTFVLGQARLIAARPGGTPGVFAHALPETGSDPWADALRLLGRSPG